MKIHVWVPDYASAIGGIQAMSRFVVRALRSNYPDARITVLAKNDTSYPAEEHRYNAGFVQIGWWPQRIRTAVFSATLFVRGWLERPDLIFMTHPHFSPVALMLRKRIGTRFATIGNGIEVWNIRKRSLKKALRGATRLLAISEFTRERMAEQLGIDASTIGLLPCMFDEDNFTPGRKPRFLLKRYGLRADQPVILTVTRLASAERYKGYDQVLQALPRIREHFPDVRYVLGGRGPDRARVEALVQELDVAENVIFAGYVPEHELREHYNLCDVFAMPSKGEGFGIVFLEAMACGKPVLAGNKDGSVDALLHGKLGTLVDPDNVDELANAICATLSQRPENRGQKSHELRREVIAAYGYEVFKNRLAQNLEGLLKS